MRRKIMEESLTASRRRGSCAVIAAGLALALSACSGNSEAESGVYRDVRAAVAEAGPTASGIAYHHQLNLLNNPWRAPERMHIGTEDITIFQEFDKRRTAETVANLAKAVQNSVLLREVLNQPSPERDFSASTSRVKHEFFVFESVQRLAMAESTGLYGPFTTSLPNLQGQVVENVTMLAPFPFRNFIYNSSMNSSIFELQAAVSNNMIDIALGQGMSDSIFRTVPDEGYARAEAIASASASIKQSVSENLALAVTIKSGKDVLAASGSGDYEYYSMITDALRDEAQYYGVNKPYLKLSPEMFARILV